VGNQRNTGLVTDLGAANAVTPTAPTQFFNIKAAVVTKNHKNKKQNLMDGFKAGNYL
jgi:hypothetical protein